jgi:hypothetical protein
VAKYFAIIPALFAAVYPGLAALIVTRLHSRSRPTSSIVHRSSCTWCVIALLKHENRDPQTHLAQYLRGFQLDSQSSAAVVSNV